nr:hypothetical protein [Tanacetum cinerariifolium]
MASTSFPRLDSGMTSAVASSPLSVITRGGSSSVKSSGDFSMVAGVLEDPDATTVSLISMTRLAVTVTDGLSGMVSRIAIMKCAESTELRQKVEYRNAKVDLAAIEAYDPDAETKYVAALHTLKDLKYPLVN